MAWQAGLAVVINPPGGLASHRASTAWAASGARPKRVIVAAPVKLDGALNIAADVDERLHQPPSPDVVAAGTRLTGSGLMPASCRLAKQWLPEGRAA